jgi:hypothetical protein
MMFYRFNKRRAGNSSRAMSRRDGVRVRPGIERLESRAMLSATMGSPPYGHAGPEFGPPHIDGPPADEMAIFGSEPHPVIHNETVEMRPADDGFGDAAGPAMPPPRRRPAPLRAPAPVILVPNDPGPPVDPVPDVATPSSPASNPVVSSPIRAPTPTLDVPPIENITSSPTSAPAVAPNINFISTQQVLNSIPSAAQIVTRNVDSAALVNAGALDSAFNAYNPQLLLAAASVAELDRDELHAAAEANKAMDTELSGFLSEPNVLSGDAIKASADAVERERQAVDAALSDLHDYDPLTVDSAMIGEENGEGQKEFDRATADADAADELLFDQDGGMVMLEATGDANTNAVLPGSHEAAESLAVPVPIGVEAAVGIYQAMDIATEESVAAPLPVTEPVRPVTLENRVSVGSVRERSGSAAAIAGATFVGGLLWTNRRRRGGAVDEKSAN